MNFSALIAQTRFWLDLPDEGEVGDFNEARVKSAVNMAITAVLGELVRESGTNRVAREVLTATWTANSVSMTLASLDAALTGAFAIEGIWPTDPDANGKSIPLIDINQATLKPRAAGRNDIYYNIYRRAASLYIDPVPTYDMEIAIAYIPAVADLSLATDEPVLAGEYHGLIPLRAAIMLKATRGQDYSGLQAEFDRQKATAVGLATRNKDANMGSAWPPPDIG